MGRRSSRRTLLLLSGFSAICLGSLGSDAQISSFQHVVIVVQENRTPDNLFQGLCTNSKSCSTSPTKTQYDIQTKDWRDNTKKGGITQPLKVALNAAYDVAHS